MADTQAERDLEGIRKAIQGAGEDLDNLNRILQDTAKRSDNITNKFRTFATEGSTSALWTTIGRLSSGSGLWAIQNKIRAVANFLKFMEKYETERLAKEQHAVELISTQDKLRRSTFKTIKAMKELEKGSLNFEEKKMITSSALYKTMTLMYGVEKGRAKIAEKLKNALIYSFKIQKSQMSERIKMYKKEEAYKKLFIGLGREEQEDLALILYLEEEREEIDKNREKIKKEIKGMPSRGDSGARAWETIGPRKKELKEQLEETYELARINSEEQKAVYEQSNLEIRGTRGVSRIGRSVKEHGEVKQRRSQLQKWFDSNKKNFTGFFKIMGGNAKTIFEFVRYGLIMFKNFLLYGTLILAGLLLLKKLGLIDTLISILKLMGTIIISSFKVIFGLITWITNVVIAFAQTFKAIFTGSNAEATAAFGNMIEVLLNGFGSFIETILVPAISSIIWAAIGVLVTTFESLFGGVKKIGRTIGAGAGMWSGASLGFSIAGPPGAVIGGVLGGLLGAEAGEGLASMFHTGGIVGKSGLQLVGERGPELVSLPMGTRITNNTDTRSRMGGNIVNNINVTVSGRLGASDTELNEIARKVGRKISGELNRYSSAGMRL